MIYWYTGQPGHGKTLHAITRLLEFKDQGRIVYACNIREFDYAKTGVLEMTPDQFKNWPYFLPDGAVALVDEAYEHGMLPKRPPGSKVPHHVEQLAKHRHRGLDFIFVSQSPDKQCDQFVQDLIERHIHVRRRFGTSYVHLREFDRYEAQAEKATPLSIKRTTLPKRAMGTYKSTELDTTERKIPWYYIALPIAAALALFLMYYTFGSMGERLGGGDAAKASSQKASAADGASATAAAGGIRDSISPAQYASRFIPRVPSQPWSAPAYDEVLTLPTEAPRLFCMSAREGFDAVGNALPASCTCLTEQGTRYEVDIGACFFIARRGQYEPFRDERGDRYADGETQVENARAEIAKRDGGMVVSGKASHVGEVSNEVKAPSGSFGRGSL